ncbi:hypothetical protein AN5623.2 [Aspergillus nidulans FGSC A4]|nr:hypothetical protein AN5623.2 [Aspergillus nidulans FGSC A4]|eukprot:XP_663227.1 hypothetical protein AN5623.2 [Aspergillus nidulans FGSC A4]
MQSATDGLQPYSSMAGKLDQKLLQALNVLGFEYMSPVQQRVLTELPTWRSDCLVQAKTGTGKTVAFLLPALHCLIQGQSQVRRGQVAILIITPTRELAQQIAKSCDELTSQLSRPLECHIAVATLPPKVKDVVSVVLNPGYTSISTVDKNEPPTHERVPQYYVLMPSVAETFTTLSSLLAHESKKNTKIIVFGVTANMVALSHSAFANGLTPLKVFEIHSRLSQSARTRTTSQFKEADAGILFASDVIGRGMDFPNVDLVVQVGLPSNAEQYVHRVGRTARAGNDGRAVILLTESESFFLKANRHLPIQPHPDASSILANATSCSPAVTQAMYAVDETTKQRAYSSYIGFFAGSGLMKQLRLDKPGLVQLANELAIKGMACPEPPPMDKKIVGKMGLKGVPGFNYASAEQLAAARPKHRGPPHAKANGNGTGTNGTPPHARARDAPSAGTGRGERNGGEKRRGGRRGGRAGRGANGGRGGQQSV